tara:strand:- start:156 stop:575 length:420 start_codon:yes stop_codon:yes gene_type:complete
MAKLKHIAIATQEPESTAHFYRDVFDLQMVGKVDSENAEGYYLSDGNVNIAVLKFKNDIVAGEQGLDYSGIHHIGFQVDDAEEADGKLRNANSLPQDDVNNALHSGMGSGQGNRNVELKYTGPDGVMLDISQGGWVGTD